MNRPNPTGGSTRPMFNSEETWYVYNDSVMKLQMKKMQFAVVICIGYTKTSRTGNRLLLLLTCWRFAVNIDGVYCTRVHRIWNRDNLHRLLFYEIHFQPRIAYSQKRSGTTVLSVVKIQ